MPRLRRSDSIRQIPFEERHPARRAVWRQCLRLRKASAKNAGSNMEVTRAIPAPGASTSPSQEGEMQSFLPAPEHSHDRLPTSGPDLSL
jgi:hypothetical protein